MTKQEVQFILKVYDGISKGRYSTGPELDEAYSYLPSNILTVATDRAKILAINRFVIFNQQLIEETLSFQELPKDEIIELPIIPTPEPIKDKMQKAREARKLKKLNEDNNN